MRELNDHLIACARMELDRLYELVRPLKYVVLLTDKDGTVIDFRGEPGEQDRYKRWGSWLGGQWSEAVEGANGIGTVIAEERAMTVHRTQHFRARYIKLSCTGAPIFDATGVLAGVVCLTSFDPTLSDTAHGMAGPIAEAYARAIGERLFRERFIRHWILAIRDPGAVQTGGLLAVNNAKQIVGADRHARAGLARRNIDPDRQPCLWELFERNSVLFATRNYEDAAFALRAVADGTRWTAMVTPPRDLKPLSLPLAHAVHTRPRLGLLFAMREAPKVTAAGLPSAVVDRLGRYIDARLDQPIDLRSLAAEANLSLHHFARAFKLSQGITPHAFVLQRRLARARELLRGSALSLSEIALAVGFADQSHFTHRFRSDAGMSPGQYRRNHHAQAA